MDLFEDAEDTSGNAPEFTVSELSGAIKRAIEDGFGHVRLRGEVGRVSRPRSGHVYLDLKDDRAVLSGVIWKGVAGRLETPPEEGMDVVVTGRITTFPGQSKYQIVIESLRPAGLGALMAMLEKRKAALAAEGLFDAERKRALPFLPDVIGVVTSPSGAVIRDILHRLRARFPRKVLVWPVAVQGAASAAEVARAVAGFNALRPGGALPRPDLLIVARGGGSVEDLWGFNEEVVVRAVAASEIPVISAVGHETDTTLVDFAADRRAPTPTAAAELAVPVRGDLLARVGESGARMLRASQDRLAARRQRLSDLSRLLPRVGQLLEAPGQRLDYLSERHSVAIERLLERRRLMLSDRAAPLKPGALQRLLIDSRRRVAVGSERLAASLDRGIALRRERFSIRAARLDTRPVLREIARGHERLAARDGLLQRSIAARLDACRRNIAAVAQADARIREQLTRETKRLDALARILDTLGYRQTLARGFAVVRDGARVLTSRAAAREASRLEIEFADGTHRVGAARSARKRPGTPAPEQGKLL